MSEAEAIEGAKQGDGECFEFLYSRHKRRVCSLCLRMVGNIEAAEDFTQEVILQLYRKIESFRGESAFSTWLHRVTVNVILMQFRKKGLMEVSLEETLGSTEDDEQKREFGSEDKVLAGAIDRVNLERVIESLPPGYRIIFVLHDIEGYEHNEIAEMLGCSIGNSKSQFHKARLKLREVLDVARAENNRRKATRKTSGFAPATNRCIAFASKSEHSYASTAPFCHLVKKPNTPVWTLYGRTSRDSHELLANCCRSCTTGFRRSRRSKGKIEMTTIIENMEQPKILVVDDDAQMRTSLRAVFEFNHFSVTTAENVGEALHIIGTEHFDVLLSDLHMHGAAEGFTVVSAMRDANANAVTLMYTGHPALEDATCATHSICQWVLGIVREDVKNCSLHSLRSREPDLLNTKHLDPQQGKFQTKCL